MLDPRGPTEGRRVNALEKLRQIVADIREPSDPMRILDEWTLAGKLLRGMPVDHKRAGEICASRDIEALDEMVSWLEGIANRQMEPAVKVPEEVMASALKAFKKRLKVGRLADESKLGGRYTSGGKKSGRDAIIPPEDFGPEVWKALEQAGKLRHTGQGFYCER